MCAAVAAAAVPAAAVGAPPPAPPFDVNDERTDDEEGAKECFEEAMGDGLTCAHYEALGEGGTLGRSRSRRTVRRATTRTTTASLRLRRDIHAASLLLRVSGGARRGKGKG